MKNNDVLVGELKSLSKGVVTYKTAYSDKDFKIDFDEVSTLSTQRFHVINLSDKTRYTGKLKPTSSGKLKIENYVGVLKEINIYDVISIEEEVYQKFWKRFTGALDIGFDMSKTNNNRQFTFAGNLKYSSDKWTSKISFNALNSSQDNRDKIERKELSLSAQRFIKTLFIEIDLAYFSSTELGIKNRYNPGFGVGTGLITNNKLYWLVGGGLNYNIEEYFDPTLNKESTEMRILTMFEMYNFEDFSLYTKLTGFPSISEKGRFRTDYSLVIKYDLPFDFYIKGDFQLNYDNQPAFEGNNVDYVLSTGFGWELK
jgi:hypothetical protein